MIVTMLVAIMAFWSRGRLLRCLPDHLEWEDIIFAPDEASFPKLDLPGKTYRIALGWRGLPCQPALRGTWKICRYKALCPRDVTGKMPRNQEEASPGEQRAIRSVEQSPARYVPGYLDTS